VIGDPTRDATLGVVGEDVSLAHQDGVGRGKPAEHVLLDEGGCLGSEWRLRLAARDD
jgi:hypothetical protein